MSTLMSIGLALGVAQSAYSEPIKERVLKEGRIKIGIHNQPPWGFKTESGEVAGFHPEMVKAVLGPLGVNKVEFVITEWGALIPGLVAGRIDAVATGLGVTPVRCEQVAFTDPDLATVDGILVKKGNPLKIYSFADIAANPKIQLGAGRGSTSAEHAISAGVSKSQIQQFPDFPALVSAMHSGRVDAIAMTSISLIMQLKDPKVTGVERAMPFKGYVENGREFALYTAIAFRPEDTALRDLYNENLAKRRADGTVDKIMAKYGFGAAETPPKGLTARDICGDKYR